MYTHWEVPRSDNADYSDWLSERKDTISFKRAGNDVSINSRSFLAKPFKEATSIVDFGLRLSERLSIFPSEDFGHVRGMCLTKIVPFSKKPRPFTGNAITKCLKGRHSMRNRLGGFRATEFGRTSDFLIRRRVWGSMDAGLRCIPNTSNVFPSLASIHCPFTYAFCRNKDGSSNYSQCRTAGTTVGGECDDMFRPCAGLSNKLSDNRYARGGDCLDAIVRNIVVGMRDITRAAAPRRLPALGHVGSPQITICRFVISSRLG